MSPQQTCLGALERSLLVLITELDERLLPLHVTESHLIPGRSGKHDAVIGI